MDVCWLVVGHSNGYHDSHRPRFIRCSSKRIFTQPKRQGSTILECELLKAAVILAADVALEAVELAPEPAAAPNRLKLFTTDEALEEVLEAIQNKQSLASETSSGNESKVNESSHMTSRPAELELELEPVATPPVDDESRLEPLEVDENDEPDATVDEESRVDATQVFSLNMSTQ